MADNDIFRKHVCKDFERASREVVRFGNIERGIRASVQAIDAVFLDWTPGAIETARRIHALALVPCPSSQEQDNLIDRIDALECPTMTPLVRAAIAVAQQSIRSGKRISQDFADFLILSAVRFVKAEVFPAAAIAGAVREYGRIRGQIVADEARFEQMLACDPEFRAKVQQATTCPKSESARPVKYRRRKPSLETLLGTPLLELAS